MDPRAREPEKPDGDEIGALAARHVREATARKGVAAVYACVVGSRIKGLSSASSDIDVRVVAKRSFSQYVTLDNPAFEELRWSVEDSGCTFEYNTWDLKRFLTLVRAGNTDAVDALRSPWVVLDESGFKEAVWSLARPGLPLKSYAAGLASNAEYNWRTYCLASEVDHRHYLYTLSSLLGLVCMRDMGELPPFAFADRVAAAVTDPVLFEEIMGIVFRKRDGAAGAGRVRSVDAFLAAMLPVNREALDGVAASPESVLAFDRLYREIIMQP